MLQFVNHRAGHDPRRDVDSLDVMLDACVDCIKVLDVDGTLLKMNRSGCIAVGLPPDETRFGMKWLDFLPADVKPRARRALRVAREGRKASFMGRTELPGHKPIHWDNILTPVLDPDGLVISILCVSRDVTRQIEAERKLRLASDFDPLTGLPNRRYFERHMTRCLKAVAKGGEQIGVLIIDVDHFKEINDLFGHDAGDHVLKTIATGFSARLRPGEFAGRLGGDEFAVVVKAVADAEALEEVAMRMRRALDEPICYEDRPLVVSLSIGGAISTPERQDISSLLKASDMALYEVKLDGRDGYRFTRDGDGDTRPDGSEETPERRAIRL